MSNWLWFVFVCGTILCWGAYGPMLHEGQMALNRNPWKAILCVGGAYFILAVIIPLVILKLQGESLAFTQRGATFASIAGVLGAFGAIFIAAALKSGGQPLYVMPLVFGGAPLMNIVVSSLLHPPREAPMVFVTISAALASRPGITVS